MKKSNLIEMLYSCDTGSIAICKNGYTFKLDRIIIHEGTVFSQIEPECYLEDIVKIQNEKGEIIWKNTI